MSSKLNLAMLAGLGYRNCEPDTGLRFDVEENGKAWTQHRAAKKLNNSTITKEVLRREFYDFAATRGNLPPIVKRQLKQLANHQPITSEARVPRQRLRASAQRTGPVFYHEPTGDSIKQAIRTTIVTSQLFRVRTISSFFLTEFAREKETHQISRKIYGVLEQLRVNGFVSRDGVDYSPRAIAGWSEEQFTNQLEQQLSRIRVTEPKQILEAV